MRDVRTGGMMGMSKDVVWNRWEERRHEERKIYWLGIKNNSGRQPVEGQCNLNFE
jgi:hypothetical protein